MSLSGTVCVPLLYNHLTQSNALSLFCFLRFVYFGNPVLYFRCFTFSHTRSLNQTLTQSLYYFLIRKPCALFSLRCFRVRQYAAHLPVFLIGFYYIHSCRLKFLNLLLGIRYFNNNGKISGTFPSELGRLSNLNQL